MFHCFGVFWTVSGIVFKADILSTDNFFERQVSCASMTLSVSVAATVQIGYRIRVLEAIGTAEHNEPVCVPLEQARMDGTKVTNAKNKF